MRVYKEVEIDVDLSVKEIFNDMSRADKKEMADLLSNELKITKRNFEHTDEQFIKDFVYYLKYQDLKGLLDILYEELR